ncbi:MAG: hypothetical protein AAF662_11325 [Pseudomonadota bacterium]
MKDSFLQRWAALLGPVTPEQRGRAFTPSRVEESSSSITTLAGNSATEIELVVGSEDTVSGYLIAGVDQPRGVAIALHQTTNPPFIGCREPFGITGDRELSYGDELAARGFVVIGIDYPHFGTYQADPYSMGYESMTAKALWNNLCLVDHAKHRWPGLSISAIGHSLGGTNAMFLAACSTHPIHTVCSAAITTFRDFSIVHRDLSRWARRDKYMPNIESSYRNDPNLVPVDYGDLPELIAPSPLFLNCPRKDDIFPVSGSRNAVRKARKYYASSGCFEAAFPDCGHEFPRNVREQSYDFLDKWSGKS